MLFVVQVILALTLQATLTTLVSDSEYFTKHIVMLYKR